MKQYGCLFRRVRLALSILACFVLAIPWALAQGTWALGPNLPGPGRYGLAATTGLDGRIYALGGGEILAGSGIYDLAMALDPATGSWSVLPPMPTARVDLAAVTGPDGRIYAIGGYARDQTFRNTVEVYDPHTNTWASGTPLPEGRHLPVAVLGQNGRIYVFAGYNAINGVIVGLTNTTYAYNLRTRTWSAVAPMPTARENAAAAVGSDGKIYVFGGYAGPNQMPTLNTVEAYDPTTNTWSTKAPMPTARGAMAAETGPDGRIYVYGGYNPLLGSLAVSEVYDPRTDTWAGGPSLLFAQSFFAGAAGRDGRLYAIGGFDPFSDYSTKVQVFNPSSSGGGVSVDISGVNVSDYGTTTATIAWATNVPSDSSVDYGLTDRYGNTAFGSSVTVGGKIEHQVKLFGLLPGTVYHYRVRSKATGGVPAVSGDYTFVTDPFVNLIDLFVHVDDVVRTSDALHYQVDVTFSNHGGRSLFRMDVNAQIGGAIEPPLPTHAGVHLASGTHQTVRFLFPASAGAPNSSTVLRIAGTDYDENDRVFGFQWWDMAITLPR